MGNRNNFIFSDVLEETYKVYNHLKIETGKVQKDKFEKGKEIIRKSCSG